ncbi:hypothetical protein DVA86_08935 [Streptomyces armeniacus]|uniref:Uncharacterized protein n=1 Tax=Streptomyces armeniacus TaxID=83291 RepID=A0A345XM85_9ACTN|nr:hypothetical protein DVA86_08935 [Streptomyces armeniacus]
MRRTAVCAGPPYAQGRRMRRAAAANAPPVRRGPVPASRICVEQEKPLAMTGVSGSVRVADRGEQGLLAAVPC